MTPPRILVTGGAGFIGSHYTRALLRNPAARVTVLDALTYAGNRDNLQPAGAHRGFRFVHGDIRDVAAVDRLVAESDQIVHFAAESHVDRSIADGRDFTETNVVGTQTLLDAARRHGVERFVHISTDEVYGSLPSGAASETAPLRPSSPYAASKAASDLMALAYHRTYGLDVRVTRCSNNYGTHQYPEKLIPRFVTRLLSGRTVPLFGDGSHVRDWLHVDDHVRGIELVRTQADRQRVSYRSPSSPALEDQGKGQRPSDHRAALPFDGVGRYDLELAGMDIREGEGVMVGVAAANMDPDTFPDPGRRLRDTTRMGAFVDDIAGFDAGFFGILPREAEQMDPQHRMMLEVAWEALEHAGIPPHRLAGGDAAVYVACPGPGDTARPTSRQPLRHHEFNLSNGLVPPVRG